MLIGIDSSPCKLSLRNASMFNFEMPSKEIVLKKIVFVQKSFFFNIFDSFNPNHAYWNQRRLFSGNLPGMFFCLKFLVSFSVRFFKFLCFGFQLISHSMLHTISLCWNYVHRLWLVFSYKRKYLVFSWVL